MATLDTSKIRERVNFLQEYNKELHWKLDAGRTVLRMGPEEGKKQIKMWEEITKKNHREMGVLFREWDRKIDKFDKAEAKREKEFEAEMKRLSKYETEIPTHESLSHEEPAVPKQLPIIKFKGSDKEYYWDVDQIQVTSVGNPKEYWNPSRDTANAIETYLADGETEMPFRYEEDYVLPSMGQVWRESGDPEHYEER